MHISWIQQYDKIRNIPSNTLTLETKTLYDTLFGVCHKAYIVAWAWHAVYNVLDSSTFK